LPGFPTAVSSPISLLPRLAAFVLRCPALRAALESAYRQARGELAAGAGAVPVDIPELTPLAARPSISRSPGPRLNLLLPGLSEQHVFGGIATALQFLDRLRGSLEVRLLVTDEVDVRPRRDSFYSDWPVYRLSDLATLDRAGSQIVACGERFDRTLPVHAEDFFVATIWWSARLVRELVEWQERTFAPAGQRKRRFVYLIQDHEPNFYAWSSRHALAAATYRDRTRTIAVFNTRLLRDFFAAGGIEFDAWYTFEPRLQPALAAARRRHATLTKERIVLAYGRPGTERNAFPILVAGLREWVARDPDAASWQIVSAGEPHGDVDLGRGMTLRALGKLPLDTYADWLARAAVGVALMISPHPSYPPLEMAAFGARVITNRWANKDLSQWSRQIDAVDPLDPGTLAAALAGASAAWRHAPAGAAGWPVTVNGIDLPASFLQSETPFPFAEALRAQWLGAPGAR
jgi:hypothetical protein